MGSGLDNNVFVQQLALAHEMSLGYDLIVKLRTMEDIRCICVSNIVIYTH